GLHDLGTDGQHRDDAGRHETSTRDMGAQRTTLLHGSSELGREVLMRATPTSCIAQERCQSRPIPPPPRWGGWRRLGRRWLVEESGGIGESGGGTPCRRLLKSKDHPDRSL